MRSAASPTTHAGRSAYAEIAKVESDADPIIWFNMVSSTMDTLELSDYADRYVVDRFSSLDGVAQVHRRTPALCDAHLAGPRPAGRTWADHRRRGNRTAQRERWNCRPAASSRPTVISPCAWSNFIKPEDFATIPLGKGRDGYVVRMGDVAKIELASAERRAYYRSNGEPGIGLGIVKTSTANSLDVAHRALKPSGLH